MREHTTRGESRLIALAAACVHHRARTLFVVGLVTVVAAVGVGSFERTPGAEVLVVDGTGEATDYERFRSTFGSDERIVVLVPSDEPFSELTLSRLQDLHAALASEPGVTDVRSLATAPDTSDLATALEELDPVAPPLAPLAGPDADLSDPTLEERALASVGIEGSLAGIDPGFVAVSLATKTTGPEDQGEALLGPVEAAQTVGRIVTIAEAANAPGFRPAVASGATLALRASSDLARRLAVAFAVVIVIAGLTTAALFRSAGRGLTPTLLVGLTLVWIVGLMGWLGLTGGGLLHLLAVSIIVVGTTHGIHLAHRHHVLTADGVAADEAAVAVIETKHRALLLAGGAVALGFGAFAAVGTGPMRTIGLLAALAVTTTIALSLTAVPAVLSFARPAASPSLWSRFGAGLNRVGSWSVHRGSAVIIGLLIVQASLTLAARSGTFETDVLRWADGTAAEQDQRTVERFLGTSTTFEVTVDSRRSGGLDDVLVIERLREMIRAIEANPIGGARPEQLENLLTMADLSPSLVDVQASLMLAAVTELGFDAQSFADPDIRIARLSFGLPVVEQVAASEDLAELERTLNDISGELDVSVTGLVPASSAGSVDLLRSLLVGIAAALATIALVVAIGIGRVNRGIAAMIPPIVPAAMLTGIMTLLGVPLDLLTLTAGAVLIAIATNSVHLSDALLRDPHRTDETGRDLERTLRSTGPANVVTALALSLGFLTLLVLPSPIQREIGLLGALTVTLALLADVMVLPALMSRLTRSEGATS